MATLVLTVIGDDQAGLVDVLSGVITEHNGNWDRSHMARLAGKFAGIVLVTVPDEKVDGLVQDLEPLHAQGLLDVAVERAKDQTTPAEFTRLSMQLVGMDHPGIVHDISHALAGHNVSIEELETATSSAPMGGGSLFTAKAILDVPRDVSVQTVTDVLEELANELMVDIELHESPNG